MFFVRFVGCFSILLCSIYSSIGLDANVTTTEKPVDEIPNFGLLDIRVGKILSVEDHPNADSLYVETVDIGELEPKTIVSSLVHFLKREDLENKLTLFVVNFKRAKLRGVVSEGMILCVSQGEKVELLIPPEGSEPGDVVLVQGYDYKPEKNIASKLYDKVEPYLRVDNDGVVTFHDVPWNISGKGVVTVKTLRNISFESKAAKPTQSSANCTLSTAAGANTSTTSDPQMNNTSTVVFVS
ncbi:aminoacyl tRNA synthase complex-interacting multifunctional protein 1-like [Planococcus citri]|uniref:aminoacyl tRNA synthase complex-interacting multifunctional protein 1-like n=1 Tax=Planococcus citri TaxID=170843 RepID=UPI0031F8C6B5